jgi:hypothetical protein
MAMADSPKDGSSRRGSSRPGAQELFEPGDRRDLLEGWLLHAHKARDRHERAARQSEWRRIALGAPAIMLSAVVGTSVFATIGRSTEPWVAFGVGVGPSAPRS